MWPLALGGARGTLTAGSAPSERSRRPSRDSARLVRSCGGLRRAGSRAAVPQAGAGASPGWRRRRSGGPGCAAESALAAACVTCFPHFAGEAVLGAACVGLATEVGCEGQSVEAAAPRSGPQASAALPAPPARAPLQHVCRRGDGQRVRGVPGHPLTPPRSAHRADPGVSPSGGRCGGTEVPAPNTLPWGHVFPSRSVSSAPGAPLLEPIPLSTSASPVCPPQARSRFLGGEGRAPHSVPSPGAATRLSVLLSSPARRQQLARQGQPPDSHHVQVPARLQQQQQLGSLAPLHQRQGKAVPPPPPSRGQARGEPGLEGLPPRPWLGRAWGGRWELCGRPVFLWVTAVSLPLS